MGAVYPIVFLNRSYRAIEEMFELLRNEYRAEASPSALTTIETAVRRVFHIRVYEHLAIALKHRQDDNWAEQIFDGLTSPESLSAIADMALRHGGRNIRHARDSLKKRMRALAA